MWGLGAGAVTCISITLLHTGLPLGSSSALSAPQCMCASVYMMSLREYCTKISNICSPFPSKPASLTSLFLLQTLPFVQGPSSNPLSHPCLLCLLSKLQRCSVERPPLLPYSHLLSLNPLTPLSPLGGGILPGPPTSCQALH